MHIALVDGIRTPPSSGLTGACPVCEREMIAKCGHIRVHHWAHRGRRICDRWWESETEWHRNWKNKFEITWHESVRHAADGEKHIADIRTPHDLVVEFQHSALGAVERAAREEFYGNMVWVVDGTRLERDFPRFEERRPLFGRTSHGAIFLLERPETVLPRQWISSSVPVLFDFKGLDAGPKDSREWLWCLLPGRAEGQAVIAAMARADFIEAVRSRPNVINSAHFVESLARSLRINREIQLLRSSYGRPRYVVPTRFRSARRR